MDWQPFLSVLLLATLVHADGGLFPPKDYTEEDLREPCQRAVVVHSKGREALFLFVDYQGKAERFAWVVPCPSMPEVAVADASLFEEAGRYFHHLRTLAWKEELERRKGQEGFGAGGGGPGEFTVTIHLTKVLGPYDLAVVSSTEGGGLAKWLNANGYRVPAGVGAVLDQYVKEKWFFAAVKVRAETGRGVTLKPLRLTFEAERPVYPLRISSVNRGVTDIRLYLFQDANAQPKKTAGPHGRTFAVRSDIRERCPRLVKAVPKANWEQFLLTRVTDTLVPQVMARLDDQIHHDRGANSVGFSPFITPARSVGIVEALMSEDPDERGWAEQNVAYYYAKPRPGNVPGEQLAALAQVGRKLGEPLRDKLVSMIRDVVSIKDTNRSRNRGPWCEGAMILLARTAAPSDPVVIRCLEEAATKPAHGNAAINALMDLGSPASRRALMRVALSGGRHRVGAAFRLVYSLERNTVSWDERPLACKELVSLLSKGIAIGDARRRGFRLLRLLTSQDLGEDLEVWSKWLAENPELKRDPGEVAREKEARRALEELSRTDPGMGEKVAALIEALRRLDRRERERAAEKLGALGAAACPALPALEKALDDGPDGKRSRVPTLAVRAMGMIGECAVPSLVRALEHRDLFVRQCAAGEFSRHASWIDQRVALCLAKLITDKKNHGRARAHAAQALSRMKPSAPKETAPALINALQDEEYLVRYYACESLGRLGLAAKDALPALEKVLSDDAVNVRDAARDAQRKIQAAVKQEARAREK